MNKSPDCLQLWFSTLSNRCCCCRCRRKFLIQSNKVCLSVELWPCIVDRLSNKCRQNCFSWNRTDHTVVQCISMNLDHSDLFSQPCRSMRSFNMKYITMVEPNCQKINHTFHEHISCFVWINTHFKCSLFSGCGRWWCWSQFFKWNICLVSANLNGVHNKLWQNA